MGNSIINANDFKKMIRAGHQILDAQSDYVNELNVFPVPDGDTGTNMNLTFTSGLDAVKDLSYDSVSDAAKDLSKGLLMGARGNSGVILSQLFRGFSQAIKNKEVINGKDLAAAFTNSAKLAYDAIMKPQEGTILTVAREAAEAGELAAKTTDDASFVMNAVYEAGQVSLENTPELLPVLKEVGVVDSGGQGLLYIYQGFSSILNGEEIDLANIDGQKVDTIDVKELAHQQDQMSSTAMSTQDIEFGFCTEIMIRIGDGEAVETFDYDIFRDYLAEFGDSLLVVADEEVAKVHIHTEQPGEIMNYGQRFGTLMKIKVDNMREQHRELKEKQNQSAESAFKKKKDYAVIAVASGSGMKDLFKNFGVDYVIEGGQTMNPSTNDFLQAVEKVNAEKVILLPNNSNIFMAAQQAADNAPTEALVVPTKNISQGLTSMLAFNPAASLEENQELMSEEMTYVLNGEVTYAVRDTKIKDMNIKKNDYMGLIDGDVILSEKNLAKAAEKTVEEMISEDSELVTIIFGDSVTENDAETLADIIQKKHKDIEVEVYNGQQPVYSYTFSVE
ncbi:MAG: DAK2 domain-containing protein [Atopococcus tabaci]|uniref:DAK2 domain-containing protein n=1 Tax=Atopococcus tabaci TaxID=269774 RepID=A0AA43RK26_9LACT|nr:DAK2 domain-containing protein [Atopococcus tabaci]